MNEQRTPEDLISESELICEKLLGWTKIRPTSPLAEIEYVGWRRPTGGEQLATPSFTTWSEAGLILEALAATLVYFEHGFDDTDNEWFCEIRPLHTIWATSGPLAIRAAAIEYMRLPCTLCTPLRKCPDHGACVTDGEL